MTKFYHNKLNQFSLQVIHDHKRQGQGLSTDGAAEPPPE